MPSQQREQPAEAEQTHQDRSSLVAGLVRLTAWIVQPREPGGFLQSCTQRFANALVVHGAVVARTNESEWR
jgi:hypothetical protein